MSVSELVEVARVDEVPPGTVRMVLVGARSLVIANAGGEFYALGGLCTHAHRPLAGAWLDGYHLVCPWHYAEFDLRTGEQVKWAYGGPLPTFPIKRVGDALFVGV